MALRVKCHHVTFVSGILWTIAIVTWLGHPLGVESAEIWGYDDADHKRIGPSEWYTLSEHCSGKQQSPINLEIQKGGVIGLSDYNFPPLIFYGDCETFELETLTDLFEWELSPNNTCYVTLPYADGKIYSLFNFHIHIPSEHTVYGQKYDGEIHFVHKENNGSRLLVTALLFMRTDEAVENNWIRQVWNSMDEGVEKQEVEVDLHVNYVDILNYHLEHSHVFNYPGSRTTPPCNEVVSWWVLMMPIHITDGELKALRQKYRERPGTSDGNDTRPVQPLNGRRLIYYHREKKVVTARMLWLALSAMFMVFILLIGMCCFFGAFKRRMMLKRYVVQALQIEESKRFLNF